MCIKCYETGDHTGLKTDCANKKQKKREGFCTIFLTSDWVMIAVVILLKVECLYDHVTWCKPSAWSSYTLYNVGELMLQIRKCWRDHFIGCRKLAWSRYKLDNVDVITLTIYHYIVNTSVRAQQQPRRRMIRGHWISQRHPSLQLGHKAENGSYGL